MAHQHDTATPTEQPAPGVGPTRPPRARRAPSRSRSGRARPDLLAVVAAGGMLGASARYGLVQWLPVSAGRFPWATFWANVSGSFLLGVLLVVLLERLPPSRYARPFLATGVLGAFTTMSGYQVESALLVSDGQAVTGLVYGVGSVVAGLGLAYSGVVAGRQLLGRGSVAS